LYAWVRGGVTAVMNCTLFGQRGAGGGGEWID
jgi:hypothetical protein